LKIQGTITKRLLRAIASDLLPPSILERPKRGFALPVKAWLTRELSEMTADIILSSPVRATGWFRTKELERLVDARHKNDGHSQRLWLLLCLGLWLSK